MLFNSLNFLIFFPITVFMFFLIPKKIKYIWLLLASYYFYMSWNPRYALLILTSTFLTWLTALGILLFKKSGLKHSILYQKMCIVFCGIVNLGMLFYFKYLDFMFDSLNVFLRKVGICITDKTFDIVLPVGISFYTFQAIGYIIDVYRGKVRAEHNFFKYALFVSFFPQLVAGPIERSDNLLRQIDNIPNVKLFDYERITNGLIYMLYGYFLKMVIADRVSLLVDTVFDAWYLYGTVELVTGAIGFAIQIYCDFSSYSTIAIGAAQVMGFKLIENFNAPYSACSIKEFWRRWHISLSTWFRDYLYIPLGGSRCSVGKKHINLMITFLASGLWHGANWTYIIWGGIHGLYQILGEILRPAKNKIYPHIGIRVDSISYKVGQVIVTFLLTDFAWIFFRAENIGMAIGYISNIFKRWNPWAISDKSLYSIGLSNYEWNVLLIALAFVLIVDSIKVLKHERIDCFLNEQGTLVKGLIIGFMILMIGIFGEYGSGFDAKQFIYFQF